jgi:hypothetical protein
MKSRERHQVLGGKQNTHVRSWGEGLVGLYIYILYMHITHIYYTYVHDYIYYTLSTYAYIYIIHRYIIIHTRW